jgi:hypothetical protein
LELVSTMLAPAVAEAVWEAHPQAFADPSTAAPLRTRTLRSAAFVSRARRTASKSQEQSTAGPREHERGEAPLRAAGASEAVDRMASVEVV